MRRRASLLQWAPMIGSGAIGAAVAGCGPLGRGDATTQPVAGPREITWSKTVGGEPRDTYWKELWRDAEEATGIKITASLEPGAEYWTKRQAEHAGGSANADIMVNQLNWVLPGGLTGMFADHYEYMRRDKVDTRQYYKADLDSWSWKGKLWSIPLQSGGEVVLYNRKLFDQKGVQHPHKNWMYDDLLDACRRLNDPDSGKFAVEVGQNGLHYMMGTFALNFGGKLLNDARDRALYGDDAPAIRGAEFDVDLHIRHRFTPPSGAVPAGQRPMELEMVAMEFNGLFRHTNVRAAIGAEHLDFAPPPKGPTGIQRVSVAGNGWSITALSRAKEAAWRALKWIHSKEGMTSSQLKAVAWPPLIWAANTREWLDQFSGTHIADCAKAWETGGHDLLPLPEGSEAWTTMNEPLGRALRGEVGTREAMQESARTLNQLISQRPPAWK